MVVCRRPPAWYPAKTIPHIFLDCGWDPVLSSALLTMDRERLDKWLEWGILGLVLAILVYGPLVCGMVRPHELIIVYGLILGVLGLSVLRLWLAPSMRILWTPLCWGVLAFVTYAIIRYWEADIEYAARQEFIKILIYATLFFTVLHHFHRQETANIIALVLVFLALGISAYAIYQFATDSKYVWHLVKPVDYMKRASGTYICPNHLAGFLEMILPIGLAYTLMGRIKPLTRILVGYASLVILAGIGVSVSRGGWIATGVALIVFFATLIKYRAYRLPAILALVVLLGLASVFVVKAHQSRKRFGEIFVSGKIENIRFRLWRPAIELWKENRWWGAGPAHFDYRFRQFRPGDVQLRPDRVHNDYLNTLADWGIVGTVLVGAAWVLLYAGVAKTWKFVHHQSNDLSSRSSNRFTFILGASTGLLAILLHSVVDFNMHIPANAVLAVILMALLSTHLRYASNRYWISLRWWGRGLTSLVLAVMTGYLGYQTYRLNRELEWIKKAEKEPEYSLDRAAFLEKAFAIEPMNFTSAYEIGEALRLQSWTGEEGYEKVATVAMEWFQRAMRLNPYDSYSYLRYGMCLDWLGKHEDAEPYYQQALKLDPNSYYVSAHQGWHLIQKGDYAGAKRWFERSLELKPADNRIASSYLSIISRRLAEPAGRQP